jgi:TetR/AcrR family transcriptional regulator
MHSALVIFSTYGKEGARMAHISNLAGVNKAALYYHFQTKDNLYRIVFQSSVKRVINSVYYDLQRSKLAKNGRAAKDILDSFWDKNPQIMKLFIHELTGGAEELRHLLWMDKSRAHKTLKKLAHIFLLMQPESELKSELTDVVLVRKATHIVAHSMTSRLVDTVISTIFLKQLQDS